jgi:ubiquinone/menaquinone biosynthesis C-methylase UbiE
MDALDVGCDTGSMAYLMRTIVGPGRVVGVDRSPTRLAQARLLAAEHGLEVEFVAGEPTQLPLPAAAFDYTWSRFSLAYLPQPEQALAELVRVTQPGGTVVVGDLDGQIAQFYPLAPPLRDDLDEALRLLGATGFDPWTGRKLYGWCQRAGLRDLVVHVLPYQVYAGGVPAGDMRDWQEKLTASSQQLVEQTGERTRWEHFRDGMLAAIQPSCCAISGLSRFGFCEVNIIIQVEG